MAMHDLADLRDARLEYPVRRGIRDHDRGEFLRVLGRLLLKVAEIDVAGVIAGNDDHAHPRHLRRRGIRAVRGAGDEADVAMPLAAACVPCTNDEKSRVFALRAGIRLDRDRGVAGCAREALLEVGDHVAVAGGLVGGRERMQVGEFAPGDRDHLAGGVELHGA
jgi:hypothetical protein